MLKNTLIIALLILAIYLYYQKQKPHLLGNSSDQEDTIRELQTQLQQAQQLQTCNEKKLTNYETQVNQLKEQIKSSPQEGDWETKTAEVIKNLEKEVSDLTTERDEAIREKKTAEQDLLATNNRLKNKSQEADNKSKEIERLKKEKSEVEIRLNKSLTEWKEKYSKREKLLDEEQLESKKLEEAKEKLQEKIKDLEKARMPGGWDYESELEQEIKEKDKKIAELTKIQQEQLREIYALFDLRAKGMKEIDFNQLYELLKEKGNNTGSPSVPRKK